MPTVYKITGESTVKPRGLPEGFAVEESSAPTDITVRTNLRREFHVSEHVSGSKFVRLSDITVGSPRYVQALVTNNEIRAMRDALTELLGEAGATVKPRVIRDGEGDLWYETAPGSGLFSWPTARGGASRFYTRRTFEQITEECDGAEFVTDHEWRA